MTEGTAAGRRRLSAWLVATLLAIGLLAAPSARATTLEPQLRIASGKDWVGSRLVSVGDSGATPFFSTAVLTWDGGSIMGSIGIDVRESYARKTLALLGRPAELQVSATPGADIPDMIDEAPAEIDARFSPTADANVCVVQGGASELKAGPGVVATVFDELRAYCEARRAAGFQVAVLTLLPRSDHPAFDQARNEFNALVRTQWSSFADALVDVAADTRIGDDGDNLDRTYYRGDHVHPNTNGCAVLAEITAPVLDALRWQATSLVWRFRNSGGPWTDWLPYTYRVSWRLTAGGGPKAVDCEYSSSGGEPVATTDTASLDTRRPRLTVLGVRKVGRRGPLTITVRVDDRRPCAATAKVTVRLLRGDQVFRVAVHRDLAVGRRHVLTLPWRLHKGEYRWRVRARDGAGNPQAEVGRGVLLVD